MDKWQRFSGRKEAEEARRLIKERYDSRLEFQDEGHKYFLDGKELRCVSDMVESWSAYDEEAMLDSCAKKAQNPRMVQYRYAGMSRDQIKAEWDFKKNKAAENGSEVHAFGESVFGWMTGQREKILPECEEMFKGEKPEPVYKGRFPDSADGVINKKRAVMRFWDTLPENEVPVLAETKVFNEGKVPYAGTFDLLLYRYDDENPANSGLVICDYKTNESLKSSYARNTKQYMKPPFNAKAPSKSYPDPLYDDSLCHYYLQLAFYQYPIERLGLKVVERRIIWLRPDGSFETVQVPYMVDRLAEALGLEMSSNQTLKG